MEEILKLGGPGAFFNLNWRKKIEKKILRGFPRKNFMGEI